MRISTLHSGPAIPRSRSIARSTTTPWRSTATDDEAAFAGVHADRAGDRVPDRVAATRRFHVYPRRADGTAQPRRHAAPPRGGKGGADRLRDRERPPALPRR